MVRFWNWHNRGTTTDNIDSFIANLQKANSQGGILRKDQMLEDLDISTSAAVLAVIAAHHPDQTNKIVTAALEMNRYLDTNYPNKLNELFDCEKLAIPALLNALETQIKQHVKDPILISKAKCLVNNTKRKINQDISATRRDAYDDHFYTYTDTIKKHHCGRVDTERLWDWHNRGTTTDNIDSFIANLQKANSQGGILRKDQMLEDRDISSSVDVLAVVAAHHPNQTNKIVTAALEMNRYLDTNYPNKSNEHFDCEKLAIPALLDVLKKQIKQHVKDQILITKAKCLVDNTKQNIMQDSSATRRNAYEGHFDAYTDTIKKHSAPPSRRGKGPVITI